ncbi:hypothetical protein MMC25_001428 [Agyrium rufum]|nr:hypothetical protein [Agyrium rufum]
MLFCFLEDPTHAYQEDSAETLLLVTSFLLLDGRNNEGTLEMMNEEGSFPRLLELVQSMKEGDPVTHRMLLELLYEMSRIQRIKVEDLVHVEVDFVTYLLQIIEGLSDDAHDPYHYPVIRVLLVLNEQYMVSAHQPTPTSRTTDTIQNLVIQILSSHGPGFRTFGENIILLLNRESETSLQLLILKLLYLLFTTPLTYEYFYTNDLRVLVDVMIRNLLDLPQSATSLRHTYLRVLYPLLANTQLRYPETHYKRDELRKVLYLIGGPDESEGDSAGLIGETGNDGAAHYGLSDAGLRHFGEIDATTKRLVKRCRGVEWLKDPEDEVGPTSRQPALSAIDTQTSPPSSSAAENENGEAGKNTDSPLDSATTSPQRKKSMGKYLTIGIHDSAAQSSVSVLEVAAQTEKPGVQTPSLGMMRRGEYGGSGESAV